MTKPTIFFSHSSSDQAYLEKLKQLLLEKTGETIDIFLSSDGQSITFGTNWVHSIEEALERADIMFVFLSPSSLRSHWVFFEAGYIYSKDIEVIPIGIFGTDLSEIDPPMNLLEGFNLNSKEQHENLISVINDKFDVSHDPSFTDEEYQRLLGVADKHHEATEPGILDAITKISLKVVPTLTPHNSEEQIEVPENIWDQILKFLEENEIECALPKSKEEQTILIHGAKFLQPKKQKTEIQIILDPYLLDRNLKLVKELLKLSYKGYEGRYWLRVFFNEQVGLTTADYAVTSRLYNTPITLSQEGFYQYKGIMFKLDEKDDERHNQRPESLRIIYEIKKLNEIPFFELLNLLSEQSLIELP